jgi:hypothetical protein
MATPSNSDNVAQECAGSVPGGTVTMSYGHMYTHKVLQH